MKSNESAAYLKGMFEGLGMDKNSPEGKLFAALLDAVETLSNEVIELQAKVQDLGEYVEELDDDLAAVEEDLYDDEDDDFDDDDDDDTTYFEVVCPSCGEVVCFDDSLEDDEITCPSCGEHLELEFEGCDGCCGEDCDACPDAEGGEDK